MNVHSTSILTEAPLAPQHAALAEVQDFADISRDHWGLALATVHGNRVAHGSPRAATSRRNQ